MPRSGQPNSTHIDPTRLKGLGAFVDGLMAAQIANRQVAAAVVTIIYKRRVLFTRGYGYADIDRHDAVNPNATLFRPGSVSKLFTWVALMQQVELGRIDLDADVNDYIDFTIPPFEDKPIRVRDLMSHSPGMSDLAYDDTMMSHVVDYRDFLRTHIPPRLWASGTQTAYSNYGAALAGYLVERVSGEPYANYVARHIFGPLGMNATFREPPGAERSALMARGYAVKDGKFVAKPFENFSFIMPAGSASATAPAMGRFIQALLGNGKLGRARILTAKSVALLEQDSLANAPHLPGMAHGFMVAREANPRMVGHGGNTVDFHSYLLLVPSADFGFYVSMTGGGGSNLARTELSDALIGRLFPTNPASRWTGSADLPVFGTYRANRRDYGRAATHASDIDVSSAGPHAVITRALDRSLYWEQVGPHLYEQVTGARSGGPFDRLEFYGSPADPRLSFASAPHELWQLEKP